MWRGEGLLVGLHINEAEIEQLLVELSHAGQRCRLSPQGIYLFHRAVQEIGSILLALLANECQPVRQELP